MADRKEIRVFISSPGDCNPERDAVGRVLDEMNRTSGERAGLFFNAVRWQDLPPGVGRNPQAVIDEELGAYNVLVGLMWMRFGTPIPGGANSGTEHEVERAIESWARVGKPRVMFYFKQGSPEDLTLIDPEQLQKVKEFRKRLQQVALVQDFHETAEFESKLRIHLNRLIDHLRCSPSDQHVVPESISKLPYGDFDRDFREVVAPVKIRDTGGLLHVVFGNIADVHSIPVVIPMGQAFDFWQRGPRSVLAAFETIRVGGRLFFDDLEQRWPRDQRPRAAGLGQTKYLKLPKNTQNLPGIMLVVTTRDLSTSKKHYGLYVNTPIEGVDFVIDRVLDEADTQGLESLALPLLGTGYANIQRTIDHAKLGSLLKQTVALLAIQGFEDRLRDLASPLKRGVVVVYSREAQGEEEHERWEAVTRFFGARPEQRELHIRTLLSSIGELCA